MMLSQALRDRRHQYGAVAFIVLVILYAGRAAIDSSGFALQLTQHKSSSSLKPDQNVAVIVENRPLDSAIPLLLHFASVLGPEWPIYLFTTQTILPKSPSLARLLAGNQLIIKQLPKTIDFKSRGDVSNFLTTPWLYQELAPAGHLLFFQTDSILCSRSPLRVEDFLKYDFVGAPIDKKYGSGFNGGLSLRNRKMFLDITTQSSWKQDVADAGAKAIGNIEFEDQWFYKKVKEYPGSSLPTEDVSKTFSVETIWQDKPLGYHQVTRWQKDRIKDVDSWCPEHRLASIEVIKT